MPLNDLQIFISIFGTALFALLMIGLLLTRSKGNTYERLYDSQMEANTLLIREIFAKSGKPKE